jgi:hypothetical protein
MPLAFLPVVSYLPLIVSLLEHLCRVFVQHRTKIDDVVNQVYPGHSAEIAASIDAVVSACTVFQAALAAYRFAQS